MSETRKIPAHVGIIMDGNGRWARKRSFHRSLGHAKGSSIVKSIIDVARLSGVQVLSLYCFSTENWVRPKDEINVLMDLLRDYLIQERDELMKGNIKVNVLGQRERLPDRVLDIVQDTIKMTSTNSGMILNFCVSYGGRNEILSAIRQISEDVKSGKLESSTIDESVVAKHLYQGGHSDVDLVIRTSGEFRSSNFMIWQAAYAEYYVTETLWPDFNAEEFHKALEWFGLRKRRFGHSDETSANARLRKIQKDENLAHES